MANYKFTLIIFIIYFCVVEAYYSVVFNTPQNIQTGTTIVISWTFSGIQTTRVELGIMDSQTSAITVIDSNVDLTKKVKLGLFLLEQEVINYI
ncbi:hypothetical protein C2G38_2064162 [Gigaspora rosea]|uniref:Uncharacterized protein n=1 Tax=Gigaspora rosea TaxID=44941 RepID=A0A397VVU6_9GLOM|nr:hypothetical protein C2G38_2064162 [Gigaspora rosea]